MLHTIEREIGIDSAHRVPDHRSKCKSLHGHRYRVIARCTGELFTEGEQNGMVLDFGFLKECMMTRIDKPCDHGTILYANDEFLINFLSEKTEEYLEHVKRLVAEQGSSLQQGSFGKLLVVDFIPTAENLARSWFNELRQDVIDRSENKADLYQMVVWETPACSAIYTNPDIIHTRKD